MITQAIDVKWLIEQDRKREKRPPVAVGTRRDPGHRDRLVDLPISFIPTKKSAPSLHHFQYEQNNEHIYIPQSDLFSCNTIAFSDELATQVCIT
jgi:hypothetical protein